VISGIPQAVLAQHGYTGAVYPVNPRYTRIADLDCYPDISAVPGPVDVALVVVNASRVVEVLEGCGRAGVRFVVIISSGFAEQFRRRGARGGRCGRSACATRGCGCSGRTPKA